MNDLEITRLCAEAMGYTITLESSRAIQVNEIWPAYDPLIDKAQAFALIEKFHVAIGWDDPIWGAFRQDNKRWVNDADLARAICTAVAKMQAAK